MKNLLYIFACLFCLISCVNVGNQSEAGLLFNGFSINAKIIGLPTAANIEIENNDNSTVVVSVLDDENHVYKLFNGFNKDDHYKLSLINPDNYSCSFQANESVGIIGVRSVLTNIVCVETHSISAKISGLPVATNIIINNNNSTESTIKIINESNHVYKLFKGLLPGAEYKLSLTNPNNYTCSFNSNESVGIIGIKDLLVNISCLYSGLPTTINYGKIIYAGGNYISIGGDSAAISSDAVTWTSVSLPFKDATSISYNPISKSLFAISESSGAISNDGGITWESVAMPAGSFKVIDFESYQNPFGGDEVFNKFTMAGESGLIRYTTDNGITWELGGDGGFPTESIFFNFNAMDQFNDGNGNSYILVGNQGALSKAITNGFSFTISNKYALESSVDLYGVACNNNTKICIAVGSKGTIAIAPPNYDYANSTDKWPTTTIGDKNFYSIVRNGNMYVAVGNNTAAYATNGDNWQATTIPAGIYRSVIYAQGKYFAVGDDGVFSQSLDGINWTMR